MYKFVLLKRHNKETNWYLIIDKHQDKLIKFANKIVESALLKDFRGENKLSLNFKRINLLLKKNIEMQKKWLKEDQILLVNESGGICFLENDSVIVKKISSNGFPKETNFNTGWLSPIGKFFPCTFGNHSLFAQEYNGIDKDLFIPIGHCDYNQCLSYIGIINVDKVTKQQINWFIKYQEYFDKEQMKILKQYSIL